jgi:hypothetical protein
MFQCDWITSCTTVHVSLFKVFVELSLISAPFPLQSPGSSTHHLLSLHHCLPLTSLQLPSCMPAATRCRQTNQQLRFAAVGQLGVLGPTLCTDAFPGLLQHIVQKQCKLFPDCFGIGSVFDHFLMNPSCV